MKSNLVFFHAFPFTSSMWKNQMDHFSKDYNCFAPNLPGFGSSPLPGHAFSFEAYVDYALNFLSQNNLQKSIWCGLSMGGYLAIRLFERAPELCQGLVLCDTKAGADGNEAKLKRWDTIKVLNTDYDKFQETQWRALIGESSQTNAKLKDQFGKLIAESSKAAIAAGLVALATRNDSMTTLAKISVPTQIIVGEEDKVTPVTEAELLHQNIKDSSLNVLKKCGHLSNLENPEMFNKELETFLKRKISA